MTTSEPGPAAVPVAPAPGTASLPTSVCGLSGIAPHPRPLGEPGPLADKSTAAMRYQSPLRYPGAKSGLVAVIGDLIANAAAELGTPELLVEPFAGERQPGCGSPGLA